MTTDAFETVQDTNPHHYWMQITYFSGGGNRKKEKNRRVDSWEDALRYMYDHKQLLGNLDTIICRRSGHPEFTFTMH